ncbi:ATP-binding protein [Aquabacterium sp. J223]|uniref:hybrid sensor histidine kinase/response regulator n=1 Tax=Aquabacterium sp. J223 TaxID=2898431 RepID=UPI0021ADA850|nr:ATP-binding protein [Aquabacterium sp. J223]UUX94264.1 ATP-binding protein [Aquabacterium sp. J223]
MLTPLAALLPAAAAAALEALPGAVAVCSGPSNLALNRAARQLFGDGGDAPAPGLLALHEALTGAGAGMNCRELRLQADGSGVRRLRLQWTVDAVDGLPPDCRLVHIALVEDAGAPADLPEHGHTLRALQDSERRFEQFAQRSDDVFWFADLARQELLYVSPGFAKLWGRDVPALLADAGLWRDAVLEQDREALPQPFFADPLPQPLREYRVRAADGRLLWLRDRRFALPAADGQPSRVGGILEDITERKRQEREREELLTSERNARAEAEALAVAKDEFLSVVSHELRSPLNAIRGWAHVLRKMLPDDPGQLKPLDAIERNVATQARMVDDLLDTQRLLRGKVVLHRQPTPLAQLTERAVDAVRTAVQDKGLELQVELPSPPLTLDVDGDRLAQALVHLLSNAVKFTSAPGRLRLLAERRGEVVALVVSDTGVGLAPERRDALFQPFSQANASRTRQQGGLGLGLTLARQLVQLHGGRLVADSDGPHRGSSFTIELPGSLARAMAEPLVPREAAGPSLSGRRIAVVDDDPQARQILELLLRDEAVRIELHASARSLYDRLRDSPRDDWPEVLISDIAMPGEDGYSLIRRVRRLTRERGHASLPAVALTAFTGTVDKQRALDAGFDAHLGKPMDPELLRRTLRSLLSSRPTPAHRP